MVDAERDVELATLLPYGVPAAEEAGESRWTDITAPSEDEGIATHLPCGGGRALTRCCGAHATCGDAAGFHFRPGTRLRVFRHAPRRLPPLETAAAAEKYSKQAAMLAVAKEKYSKPVIGLPSARPQSERAATATAEAVATKRGTVVLLHGMLCSHRALRPLVEALCADGCEPRCARSLVPISHCTFSACSRPTRRRGRIASTHTTHSRPAHVRSPVAYAGAAGSA